MRVPRVPRPPPPTPTSPPQVYLTGVAHVSRESAADAAAAVASVRPATVVLELDAGRLAALLASRDSGDVYGLAKYRGASKPRLAWAALTGGGPPFLLGLAYAAAGAVVGAKAGSEFVAAYDAAEAAGASVAVGDRDQRVTLQRLLAATAAASQRAAVERARANGPPTLGGPEGQGTRASPADAPVFGGRGVPAPSARGDGDAADDDAPTDDQWHLGPALDGPEGREARWRSFLESSGCPGAAAAVSAFRRAVALGTKGSPIPIDDLSALRECGRGLVEATRAAAVVGGGQASALRRLEHAAAAEAAAGGGPVPAPALRALERVLGDERDAVLASSLWRAAAASPGDAVVGVVGAAHVAGIKRLWSEAGTPAFEARADALRAPPAGRSAPGAAASPVPALTAGVLLVALSVRRPKAALFVGASAAALATPFAALAATAMDRWARLGAAVGDAATALDAREGGGGWSGETGNWGSGDGL